MKGLIEYLGKIEDKRKEKGKRHQLLPTLVIIMAMLCGHTGLKAIERFAKAHREMLKEYLPLPRGKTPSLATIHRIMKGIDPEEVIKYFNEWMEQYLREEPIAVDGKSIRSTVEASCSAEQNFVSLVSFFGQQSQLIVKACPREDGDRNVGKSKSE